MSPIIVLPFTADELTDVRRYSGLWVEYRSVSRLASPEFESVILDVSSNHIRTGCYTVVQPKRTLVMTHYCIARQSIPSLGPVF